MNQSQPFGLFQVLLDLRLPCNRVETHLICKLLDPGSTQIIDVRNFRCDTIQSFVNYQHRDGIRLIRGAHTLPSKDPERLLQPVFVSKLWQPLSDQDFPRFLQLLPFLVQPNSTCFTLTRRYVLLDIRLVTFANDSTFVGHVKNELAPSHMTVYTLKQIVKKKTDVASSQVTLLRDPVKNKQAVLNEQQTLEQAGFAGGPYENPCAYTIYYDFATGFGHEPLVFSSVAKK
jgi:hypothetical protein